MLNSLLKETITDEDLRSFVVNICSTLKKNQSEKSNKVRSILLLPPDITRLDSQAGRIVNFFYQELSSTFSLAVLPATGLHPPMNKKEKLRMFGEEYKKMNFFNHSPIDNLISLGKYDLINEGLKKIFKKEKLIQLILNNDNLAKDSLLVDIKINKLIFEFDLIFSIGQVLPHEVVGVSNFTKNIIIGLGGIDLIENTHFLGALIGLFKIVGQGDNPIRNIIDDIFFSKVKPKNPNIEFVLTVINPRRNFSSKAKLINNNSAKKNQTRENENINEGVYWLPKAEKEDGKKSFQPVINNCLKCNVIFLRQKIKRAYAWMPEVKYSNTWVANKAIYRLGEIIEDGGELFIIALGVKSFSHHSPTNQMIKKIGYRDKNYILKKMVELKKAGIPLKKNLATFAHLIHGGDVGFKVTYITRAELRERDLKGVGFNYKTREWGINFYQKNKNFFLQNFYNQEEGYFYDPGLLAYKIKS